MNNTQVLILIPAQHSLVLRKINFKPMLTYVLQTATEISEHKPTIWFENEEIKAFVNDCAVCTDSPELLADTIAVVSGNLPLLTAKTLQKAIAFHRENKNQVTSIGLANENAAIFDKDTLVSLLKDDFTLTDILAKVHQKGGKTATYLTETETECLACKNAKDIATADKIIRTRVTDALLEADVTIIDPASTYIEQGVQIGKNTVVYPGAVLEGNTVIGEDCVLYPNCNIKNCKIGDRVEIKSSTLIDSSVGDETTVGPYAYVRPGNEIGNHVKVGDFVELNKSKIGDDTQISHLTYVGDAIVGKNVNFGCGTVTVNYDGIQKFTTEIGDGAFIGCNTNLVAPVKIGKNAFVAAGSTITDEVPPDAFAIARTRQTVKEQWVKPKDKQS
ncbi:MAG: UDP-N-acetylglucosamine pyrophosphorylase [Clostridia bacterium]|nr:UDP-N-acetylglucosamine pyrophosphorylase [Clostridia bacterium]